jgi:arylsulfatase A-like enzyme
MLTGLPPLSHGVLVNTGVLNDHVLTLAERLRGAGFHTAAFINNYYLESRFGFDQGFETFIDQYRASRLDSWDPRLLLRGTALYHAFIRATRRPGARSDDTIDLTLDWLRNRPAGDFFVFLHIMDPHAPYAPPEDLRRKFQSPEDEERTHPTTGKKLEPVRDNAALRARIDTLTPHEISGMRNLYDGDLALADRKVGRLVAELRRLGLFDSTLLIVTADHGEVLYEKEHDFDHGFIWNGDLHVPLVMSYPGRVPAGEIVDEAVAGAAIPATACALLDVPYEEQTEAAFYGSLLAAGPAGSSAPNSPPSGENEEKIVCALAGLKDNSMVTAAMGPRYKLIVWPDGRNMLYDLQHDPFELTDLWPPRDPSQLEAVRRLREHLSAWLVATQAHAIGESRQEDDIDRETRRRLRSIGYVH